MGDLPFPITASAPLSNITGIQTYEIPTVVIYRSDFGLEIYSALTGNDVVIAKALVPRSILEFPLTVHIHPRSLEAQYATCGKVHSTVVEIVSYRQLGPISNLSSPDLEKPLTKALQFFKAQTCPTYEDVSTAKFVSEATR